MSQIRGRWDERRRRWRGRAQRYKGDPLGGAGVLRRRLAAILGGVDTEASLSIEYSLPVLESANWLMERTEVDKTAFAQCPETCPVFPPLGHEYTGRSNYVLGAALVDTRSGFAYVNHLGRSTLIRESTSWPASHALWSVSRPTDGTLIDAPLTILSSPSNYFHFMTEDFPALLRVLDQWPDITVGVCKGLRPPYVDAALEAIGIRPVVLDRLVRVGALHLAGRGQDLGYLRPYDHMQVLRAFSILETSDSGQTPSGQGIIFASRGHATRAGQTEQEAQKIAQDLGAEVVDFSALSLIDQARVASQSSVVIGSHGAALTNALFCPPGSMLVELLSPNYHNRCYEWLAHTSNLQYKPAYSLAQLQAMVTAWADDYPA